MILPSKADGGISCQHRLFIGAQEETFLAFSCHRSTDLIVSMFYDQEFEPSLTRVIAPAGRRGYELVLAVTTLIILRLLASRSKMLALGSIRADLGTSDWCGFDNG